MRTLTLALISLGLASTASAQDLLIGGSSTVDPFAKEVVTTYIEATGNPAPVISSDGTGGGFELFCTGQTDISKASRAIKDSEAELCAATVDAEGATIPIVTPIEFLVGYDGIVFATNAGSPLDGLSLAQIYTAFVVGASETPPMQWSDIDPALPELPIYGIIPPSTSGTKDAMMELAIEAGCEQVYGDGASQCETIELRTDVVETGTEEDNLTLVQLGNNGPGAIAVFGYAYLLTGTSVEAVSIEGVAPAEETIADGSYPLSRPLYLYASTESVASGAPVQDYLRVFFGEDSMDAVFGSLPIIGLITLGDEELAEVRARVEALQ